MKQMTIGEMISVLERKDATLSVSYDFAYFRPKGIGSYRGYYEQLALGYTNEHGEWPTVIDVLNILRGALGKTFHGYKGGEYVMGGDAPMWVANNGESPGTAIVDIRDEGWCVRLITACID